MTSHSTSWQSSAIPSPTDSRSASGRGDFTSPMVYCTASPDTLRMNVASRPCAAPRRTSRVSPRASPSSSKAHSRLSTRSIGHLVHRRPRLGKLHLELCRKQQWSQLRKSHSEEENKTNNIFTELLLDPELSLGEPLPDLYLLPKQVKLLLGLHDQLKVGAHIHSGLL
jgi:hypothetical protein